MDKQVEMRTRLFGSIVLIDGHRYVVLDYCRAHREDLVGNIIQLEGHELVTPAPFEKPASC